MQLLLRERKHNLAVFSTPCFTPPKKSFLYSLLKFIKHTQFTLFKSITRNMKKLLSFWRAFQIVQVIMVETEHNLFFLYSTFLHCLLWWLYSIEYTFPNGTFFHILIKQIDAIPFFCYENAIEWKTRWCALAYKTLDMLQD